ncbi:MAG: DUF896 domain-containing protein [Clostridia bacterium]|nr:DUF896 domain-containing protein [Clostridia bacterium]
MDKEKIERINFLARKAKETTLSEEEKSEQAALRAEYIAEFRASFGGIMSNTVIKRPDGTIEPLKKKNTPKH